MNMIFHYSPGTGYDHHSLQNLSTRDLILTLMNFLLQSSQVISEHSLPSNTATLLTDKSVTNNNNGSVTNNSVELSQH